MIRAWRDLFQMLERPIQKSRSSVVTLGRLVFLLNTMSCRRRARFSRTMASDPLPSNRRNRNKDKKNAAMSPNCSRYLAAKSTASHRRICGDPHVDVINPFDSVHVALVYSVHPQITGPPFRFGPAALSNRYRRGPGL